VEAVNEVGNPTILATFGMSLILQNYALWQFGPVARKINEPYTGHFNLFYLEYPWYRLMIAGLSAAIIGGFWLFLKHGRFGIWIRATMQDRVMAQAMGIPVPLVHTVAFAIGAGTCLPIAQQEREVRVDLARADTQIVVVGARERAIVRTGELW